MSKNSPNVCISVKTGIRYLHIWQRVSGCQISSKLSGIKCVKRSQHRLRDKENQENLRRKRHMSFSEKVTVGVPVVYRLLLDLLVYCQQTDSPLPRTGFSGYTVIQWSRHFGFPFFRFIVIFFATRVWVTPEELGVSSGQCGVNSEQWVVSSEQ